MSHLPYFLLPRCVITYCGPKWCGVRVSFLIPGFPLLSFLVFRFYLRFVLIARLLRLVTCAFVHLRRDGGGFD